VIVGCIERFEAWVALAARTNVLFPEDFIPALWVEAHENDVSFPWFQIGECMLNQESAVSPQLVLLFVDKDVVLLLAVVAVIGELDIWNGVTGCEIVHVDHVFLLV
jgi:hypothetical protein